MNTNAYNVIRNFFEPVAGKSIGHSLLFVLPALRDRTLVRLRRYSSPVKSRAHKTNLHPARRMSALLSLLIFHILSYAQQRPNIIFILTDDMGVGDIGCFNGTYKTPNLDRMASEGRKFTGYYSASPICSPSRVGFLTGMHPAKWNITSFLQKKVDNRKCEQADYLDPSAPSIARILQQSGYATAHFGKWHMGGGRDVEDAPSIEKYGFDEWSSTWESPNPDSLLTATDWIWSDKDSIRRWSRTKYWVDKTLTFLAANKNKPCYINLWPDDVHTPWVPGDDSQGRYAGKPEEEKSFANVLAQYDLQMGRLLDGLKKLGIDKNTLVIFTSDNGPLPNFRHDRSASLRGTKLSLYEGGIRMPFIAWWPGKIKSGTTDSVSILCAADLLPSFVRLGKASLPKNYVGDGEDRSAVLLGRPASRNKAIYWEYGRNEISFKYPPRPEDRSPSLAIRERHWKLLMNADGSGVELYNMAIDRNETKNISAQEQTVVKNLSEKLLTWWKSLPVLPTQKDKP